MSYDTILATKSVIEKQGWDWLHEASEQFRDEFTSQDYARLTLAEDIKTLVGFAKTPTFLLDGKPLPVGVGLPSIIVTTGDGRELICFPCTDSEGRRVLFWAYQDKPVSDGQIRHACNQKNGRRP